MADRTFYPSFSYGFGRVNLAFSFLTNNATSPTLSSIVGVGTDVVTALTRTAQGRITVQLSPRDHYVNVVWADAALDDSGPDGAYATTSSFTNLGTISGVLFTVHTNAAGGAETDFVSRRCYVSLMFKNSKATFAGG